MMYCPICDQKPMNCDCTPEERRMHAEIEELEEQVPRWIPVTERLPEEGGVFPYVLAKIGGMHYPAIARRSESTSGWVELGDLRLFAAWEITHWMPLPAPPTDGK
jgi:hypothetical protein